MAGKNSLIDNDFMEDGEDFDQEPKDQFDDEHADERALFSDQEVDTGKKKKSDDIEVDVVNDTPEEDRDKWVADDDRDGEPDLPDDDEVKTYSKRVQSRLKELTARVHAERRRADERDRTFNEAITHAQRLLDENNNLKGMLESGEKVLIGEHKGRLEGALASAKAAFREASEAGDTNGILAAQEEIARVVSQMERATSHRPQQYQRTDPTTFARYSQPSGQNGQNAAQPSDRAQQWREQNKWFDNDIPMQAYALGVHKQLADEGVQIDSPDYYKKIDTEMRRRFPDRFKREPRRQGTPVAPAGRSGGGTSPKKVTLTESQVRIARRLGLSPEQMAEQILAEQKNGQRDFTHTKRP